MIRSLRNFSVCLWVSSLFSVPFSFYAIPWVRRVFSGVSPEFVAICVVVIFYGLITAGFHFLGRKMILGFIREGMIWDQAGLTEKARKRYGSAVRIFDSFLLFPLIGKKIGEELIRALAKFFLEPGTGNTDFGYQASCIYLSSNPGDTVLAELWLRKFLERHKKSGLGPGETGDLEGEVLTVLAGIHYDNEILQALLTEAFLGLGRVDYSARQLYARTMDRPELKGVFETRVEALLASSRQIPEAAGAGLRDFIPITAEQAYQEDREAVESGPLPKEKPVLLSAGKLMTGAGKVVSAACTAGIKAGKSSALYLLSISGSFICLVSDMVARARQREKFGAYLRSGIIGVLAILLLIFIVNTISHIQHPSSVEKVGQTIEAQIPKPFTIQVAAYLKQAHADRYLNILNKKDLDAFIEKVEGGGKTWYVIRISRFPDKKSAEAFGNRLKKQKIIEDFFVCNR